MPHFEVRRCVLRCGGGEAGRDKAVGEGQFPVGLSVCCQLAKRRGLKKNRKAVHIETKLFGLGQ
jgi:hypothetical protein